MTRLFAIVFTALTLGATALTYFDVGTGSKQLTVIKQEKSVRTGSYGGVYYGGGGYRTGK